MLVRSALFLFGISEVAGHGQMVFPPSNRHKGSYAEGGGCDNEFSCLWFSQPVEIPGEPILNEQKFRTYNVEVNGGEKDWSKKMPWRHPGAAPVYGSGCGTAGGGPVGYENGGYPPPGINQGFDGINLPAQNPTKWKRGEKVEVGFGMLSNHGGGYSYRLCWADSNVSEACFQRHVLNFTNTHHKLRWADIWQPYGKAKQLPDYEIPLIKWVDPVTNHQWARNPVPGCYLCDQGDCMNRGLSFDDEQHCSQSCSGMNMTHCPPGLVQFPEPLNGISGFDQLGPEGWTGFQWSIVDEVEVPHYRPGKYLLSWRWDCEQSAQIWQNCADIEIV